MKNLLSLLVIVLFLTSCGNKLYSYRKTVKVKGESAKLEKRTSEPKAYITVKEVKPTAKAKTPKATNPALDVNHNTVYLTTKPVQNAEESTTTTTVSMPNAHYSATVR